MAAPIVIFLHRHQMVAATSFMLLAVVSDALDGYLARRLNAVSVLGKALDPAADKICILSVILFLVIKNKIPMYFLVIVGGRDLLLCILHLYLVNFRSIVTGANMAGKVTTILLSVALFAYIYDIGDLIIPVTYAVYVTMTISFLQYFTIFLRNFGRRGSQAG